MNSVTVAEIKRRGMAAIEDGLRQGPLHILKRNRPAAVVLSEAEYQRLTQGVAPTRPAVSALQWLISQPAGQRDKTDIDRDLQAERADWDQR